MKWHKLAIKAYMMVGQILPGNFKVLRTFVKKNYHGIDASHITNIDEVLLISDTPMG